MIEQRQPPEQGNDHQAGDAHAPQQLAPDLRGFVLFARQRAEIRTFV
jgi:hypothetical protein